MNSLPIGVFDSGVGGVSVLRHMLALMPNENYIYLGDSKNAPYGTKSHEEILMCASKCADYLISKGIKILVVACNTATSVCIDSLRQKYRDINVVGIEPALKPAVMTGGFPTVAVMATPLTLKEQKFDKLMKQYSSESTIIPMPCPGLMEIVEDGKADSDECREYLKNIFKGIDKLDAVVLGCTHYPFVSAVIKSLYPDAEIFDGGEGTARQVQRLLAKDNLLTSSKTKGNVIFENTLSDEKVNELAKKLLN